MGRGVAPAAESGAAAGVGGGTLYTTHRRSTAIFLPNFTGTSGGFCSVFALRDHEQILNRFPMERIFGAKYEIGSSSYPEVVLSVAKLNPKCIPSKTDKYDPVTKWQYKAMQYVVTSPNTDTLDLFYEQMQRKLEYLRRGRPSKLRVFINPVGGKRRGIKLFNGCRGLFSSAGVELDVTVTRYAGHAGDCARTELFDDVDGIVVVGGDGMLSEVLNGLHMREDKVRPIVGLLPAGSTNTVVLTVMRNPNFNSAVLNIILGRKSYLDQGLIERRGKRPFYFSNFVGFGFFGDVIEHSEKYRWCGPSRYTYSGAINLMKSRSYEVEVEFQRSRDDPKTEKISGRFKAINVALMACITKDSVQGMAPAKRCDDGSFHLILVQKCSRMQYLQYLMRTAGKADQFALRNVTMIEACKVSISPSALNRGRAPPGNRWNVDGELLDEERVTLTNMLHSMKIFGCSARNEYIAPKPRFRYGRRWLRRASRNPSSRAHDGEQNGHVDGPASPHTPGGKRLSLDGRSLGGYDSPTFEAGAFHAHTRGGSRLIPAASGDVKRTLTGESHLSVFSDASTPVIAGAPAPAPDFSLDNTAAMAGRADRSPPVHVGAAAGVDMMVTEI